jgi:hypothetical protein
LLLYADGGIHDFDKPDVVKAMNIAVYSIVVGSCLGCQHIVIGRDDFNTANSSSITTAIAF